MTRCDQVRHDQANAIQKLWALHHKLEIKVESDERITRADLDQLKGQVDTMAEALKLCR